MLNYTATIFEQSGSNISPNLSAVIVGATQLLGTYVATFLVDRLGRRFLLIASSVSTGLTLLVFGSYTYAHQLGFDVSPFSWVSIVCFSGIMFLTSCGIIPLVPVVIFEVLPDKVSSSRIHMSGLLHQHLPILRFVPSAARYASAGLGRWCLS